MELGKEADMKSFIESRVFARITVVIILAFGLQVARSQDAKKPANVKFTAAAWTELEKGNFDAAIKNAKAVIEDFEPDADADQEKLKKSHAADPPNGPAASSKEEQETLRRGPLNDVATCYWIMGQAYEKKGDLLQAKSSYQMAAKYTYARAWDQDQHIFWSPADKAANRAKRMK
jgi:hypothetical protein